MLRAEKNKKLYMGSCQHICMVPPQAHFQEKICSTPANTESINSISKKGSFPLNLFIFWGQSLPGIITCSI